MADESMNFNLDSNIGDAAKDVDKFASSLTKAQKAVTDLNKNLKIQNNVVADLEDSVELLEKKMIDTPKSAMGWSDLNKVLQKTKLELKGEKDAMKELNAEVKTAEGNLKKATKEQDGLNKSAKKGKGAMGILKTGFKGVGMAFKALGIGLIIAVFAALKEAVERNQTAMDAINAIVSTVSATFNQVVTVLSDTVKWVMESSDRFDGMKAVITGLMTIAITPLKLAFYAIKLAVQGAMLAWEKSFFGGNDAGKIKSLTADIRATKDDIKATGQAAIDAGKSVVNNIGDAISEISAIGKMATEGISKISIAANYEASKSAVAAKNSAALAAVEIQGLIEQYDRQAEQQRQIRDDVSASMAERIAANEELGRILEEQSTAMLQQADIRIAAAQQELAMNQDNLDLQIALKEAINERAGIEAQITGLRSEQLVNINALMLEQQALDDEAFAKKMEEEQMLMDLMDENLLASIENLEEKALKELEIQQAKDIELIAEMDNFEALKAQIDIKYDKKRDKLEKTKAKADKKIAKLEMKGKLDLAKQTFDNLAVLMGKGSKAGKAAAAAGATISAIQGAVSAFASLAPIPFVGPVLGGIAAAAALVSGYANVKQIYATKTDLPGDSSGGGPGPSASAPDISAAADTAASSGAIAPQMVGGAFELGGGVAPESTKAYVVADEMTDQQDQLAGIRRRASV